MADFSAIVVKGLLEGPTYYAERYMEYMAEHDILFHVVDVKVPETYNSEEFYKFASRPDVIMFTINNVGVDLKDASGDNFWKARGIRVFEQIVDHPRYYGKTMIDPPCDLYVFSLDRSHVDFIRRYYPKVKQVFFSPNGGWSVDDKTPFKDRHIEVLYMGDCQEALDSFPPIPLFSDGGQDFYGQVISELLNRPDTCVETAIENYIKACGASLNDDELLELNRNYGYYVETPVRRHFKLEGITALDRMGVKVQIFGRNWIDKEYAFSDNITVNDRIKRAPLMEKIGDAKISLCFIPWFKKGCSEKNFDSMLNGAVCVTDRSEYLSENYTDKENIIYFDLNDPMKMASEVRHLLDDPDEASKIAENGRKTAEDHDTWFCRFEYITKTINGIMNSGPV